MIDHQPIRVPWLKYPFRVCIYLVGKPRVNQTQRMIAHPLRCRRSHRVFISFDLKCLCELNGRISPTELALNRCELLTHLAPSNI